MIGIYNLVSKIKNLVTDLVAKVLTIVIENL